MIQPAAEQLLNLANRAEKGLTPDEAQRLRDGINALHSRVEDWRTSTGAGLRLIDELRAERDALAAGVPLVCSDDRHKAKVFALEMARRRAEERAERAEAAIERVRKTAAELINTGAVWDGNEQEAGRAILAALDEHQEQPPVAAPEPVCNCTWGGLELRRCPVHEPTT